MRPFVFVLSICYSMILSPTGHAAELPVGSFASSWQIVSPDTLDKDTDAYNLQFVRLYAADSNHLMNIYRNVIQTSTDAGRTWAVSHYRNKYDETKFYAISYTTPSFAIAVGDSGTILRTTDGGKTWEDQRSGFTTPLYHIAMLDTLHGVLGHLPQEKHLRRTSDGGKTWEPLEMPASVFPSAQFGIITLLYPAPGVIIAMLEWDSTTRLVRTDDDGETWQSYEMPAHARMVYAVNSELLYGIGKRPVDPANPNDHRKYDQIFISRDGGQTWSYQLNQINEPQWGLQFLGILNENTLVAGGDGKLYYTTDGGNSWIRDTSLAINISPNTYVYAHPVFLSDSTLVCSYSGNLLRITIAQLPTGVSEQTAHLPTVEVMVAPLPADSRTSMRLILHRPENLAATLFDATGNFIARVFTGHLPSGEHVVPIPTESLAAGSYYLQISSGQYIWTRQVIVIR